MNECQLNNMCSLRKPNVGISSEGKGQITLTFCTLNNSTVWVYVDAKLEFILSMRTFAGTLQAAMVILRFES